MFNLVVDIGNTFSKVAVFKDRQILELEVSENLSADHLAGWFQKYPLSNAVLSTVRKDAGEPGAFLQSRCRYIEFSTKISAGIINHYKTPSTLGLDRYAAVIGAKALLPERDCLVIDAGTCITYDFIDSKGNYWGGSISPGIGMRFRAMNTFTGRLPLIEFDESFQDEYGLDTADALLSGVNNGIFFEVKGFIEQYSRNWPQAKVLLCGGDVNFFDRRLKNSIFAASIKAEPNLVLIGLNEVIHQYND